jgi:hypothetical protein
MDTIKPEETIPQYIERVQGQTAETLRGYATRAYLAENYKLHWAILNLIKQKKSADVDAHYTAFLTRLQENKVQREAAVARPPAPEPKLEAGNPEIVAKDHLRDIRKIFAKDDELTAEKTRKIILKQAAVNAACATAPYEKYLYHKDSIINEVKGMLEGHTEASAEGRYSRAQQIENISMLFNYIISDTKDFIAYQAKFRDTVAQRILEFKNRSVRPTDSPEFQPLLVRAKEFLLTEVPTSPLYIPSEWEIDDGQEPLAATEEEREMHSEFAPLRKNYQHLFEQAKAYYDSLAGSSAAQQEGSAKIETTAPQLLPLPSPPALPE